MGDHANPGSGRWLASGNAGRTLCRGAGAGNRRLGGPCARGLRSGGAFQAYPARPPEDPVLREARDELRSVGVPIEADRSSPARASDHQRTGKQRLTTWPRSAAARRERERQSFPGKHRPEVIRKARVPILVVRATEMGDPAGGEKPPHLTLLVPTDGLAGLLSAADPVPR